MPNILRVQYQLQWKETRDVWEVTFVVPEPYHHTSHFPRTIEILRRQLPLILQCECFNDEGLPFYQEVKATEMGHLLEHIVLEHLCKEKLSAGHSCAEFRGRTSWNWVEEAKGTFHITIHKDKTYAAHFQDALQKSMNLLHRILRSPRLSFVPISTYS